MLGSAAARLAAIEALCPTESLQTGQGFPTMAQDMVLDSRSIAIEELKPARSFTPVIGVYSADARRQLRGDATDTADMINVAVLEFVAELAVSGIDEGAHFVDAMLGDDPAARLTLDALCAQIDYTLEYSDAGRIFRRIVSRVTDTEYLPFAVPQLGLRYQRVTIRKTCSIRRTDFEVPDGTLPEPLRTLQGALPAQSYAAAALAELARQFRPDRLPALDEVRVTSGPVTSGF